MTLGRGRGDGAVASPAGEGQLSGTRGLETPTVEVRSSLGAPPAGSPDPKRRFTVAVLIGLAVVAVPYLWVLFDLWHGSPSFLRTAESNGYASNFYDLQARAMFHGHLYVANGALGGEAFVHDGRQYTYFGLFPSLLRMPFLLLTHSLDGRLTAPSMLLAWLTTGLFSSLLVWRVRILLRGPVLLGRAEAASYGVLVATIMGGSVLVSLASDPWVFSEDLAWSVAATVGSLFALLGVLERPSSGRVIACGVLILAANLTRGTTGYACVIGAVLVAVWFALGRGGAENRRWALPIATAGIVPLAVGSAVTYAKFGILLGLPVSDQIAYQSFGLSHVGNGGYFGLRFLPSTLLAYLQPGGLRLTPVFPFITLPSAPARMVGSAMLYGSDRTASAPAAMPLLVLASLWGVVSAFRPRPVGRSNLFRIVLVAAAAGAATVMIYGWIENRFLADVVPLLILAASIGVVDVWRRLEVGRRGVRYLTLAIVTALGAFGIAANVGMAITPQKTWSESQILRYVEFQKTISDLTGHPLAENVVRGETLPNLAPVDQLFVVGRCESLYISDGDVPADRNPTFPARSVELSLLWYPVELGPDVRHTLDLTFRGPVTNLGKSVPLVTIGTHALSTISVQPFGAGEVRFSLTDPRGSALGTPLRVEGGRTYRITIVTDPNLHVVSVSSPEGNLLSGLLSSHGPVVVHTLDSGPGQPPPAMTVVDATGPAPDMALCRSLP
jgi:hypothetical protein